jgi:anti-sigma factor RsiW
VDRKAAAFMFRRRLHPISLFVFRADGLVSSAGAAKLSAEPVEAGERGFNVLLWQSADLGYALVSDVSVSELQALAKLLQSGS